MGLAEWRFELNVTVSYSLYATVSVVLYMKYFFNSNSRSSSKDSTSNKKFTNIPNSIIPFCLYLHKKWHCLPKISIFKTTKNVETSRVSFEIDWNSRIC